MKIDAYFTTAEVDPASLAESTVVVIDVLRATTTVVEALANGARGIFPTASTEEAVKLAHSLGRDDTLLCGERRGEKVEGFDLGNSPREFTREAVAEKRLVISTTNGTRAFLVAQDAARMLVCAFTNLSAVARAIVSDDEVVIVCAGRDDQFSLDDALCAGHLIAKVVVELGGEHELNDGAAAARLLALNRKASTRVLAETWSGRALTDIGLGEDLDVCSDVDRHDIVGEMRDRAIVLGA